MSCQAINGQSYKFLSVQWGEKYCGRLHMWTAMFDQQYHNKRVLDTTLISDNKMLSEG